MNKTEFIIELTKFNKKSLKENKVLVDNFFYLLTDVLKKGERITFNKIGTFVLKQKNERFYINPLTGVKFLALPKKVIVFRQSNRLL